MSTEVEVNPENQWRTLSEDPRGWARTPRPNAELKKYFIASVDSHITPPRNLFRDRIDERFRDRLPRMEKREDGMYILTDGQKPFRLVDTTATGEDLYRAKAGSMTEDLEADMAIRLADMDKDGIDCEVVYPNGPAITAYHTPDMEFAMAQFRIYNDWALDLNKRYGDRCLIVPCVATGDVQAAAKEIERIAAQGSSIVSLPTQPIPGGEGSDLHYNHRQFEPLWDVLSETGVKMAFHVATGGDPRKARGPGGAIMNRVISHEALGAPIAAFCASGILDRHQSLKFACVEAGIGWIPAMLDLMDETYLKHHMWVSPKLKHGLPSDYFRAHAIASFQEDRAGLLLVEEFGLQDNIMWSNDYPHHEGTWPHSAAAIERGFAHLSEETRAKILGLNAAKFFGFKIPSHLA